MLGWVMTIVIRIVGKSVVVTGLAAGVAWGSVGNRGVGLGPRFDFADEREEHSQSGYSDGKGSYAEEDYPDYLGRG